MNLSLTHIVIDEAAQAIECEALIALTLANQNTRLILAGDQMQLAPEIYSVLATERGLGVSLLERMYEFYPPEHPCRIHLCQNYRAHADIIKYTSEMFYEGMVKPANTELLKHPTMKPLTFYAVRGQEEQVYRLFRSAERNKSLRCNLSVKRNKHAHISLIRFWFIIKLLCSCSSLSMYRSRCCNKKYSTIDFLKSDFCSSYI